MSYSRAKQLLTTLSGAGGGGPTPGGTVGWGPNFGGINGDQLQATSLISFWNANLTGNLNESSSTLLSALEIVYNNIVQSTALATIDNINPVYNLVNATGSSSFTSLSTIYNVVNASGSILGVLSPSYTLINATNSSALYSYFADYLAYANSNDSTTGDWTSASNALGNTTSTSAILRAASSGIGGITANGAAGVITLGFRDPTEISTFTLDGTVTINVERSITSEGTLPLSQSVDVTWEASVNGTTWNTIQHDTTFVSKGTVSLDITSVVSGSWTNINNLQVRSDGTINSGTGLGAAVQVDFYRSWVDFTATKII